MTTPPTDWRRYFAEEIQVVANLRTAAIVDALATVPREAFLPDGPWTIRSEAEIMSPPRQTPGSDPRFVSHNVAVAIDPARMLFNDAPSVISMAIDALEPRSGDHALHLGAGTGYYSAIGLRDETLNAAIGQALARHPFPPLKSVRRDPHDADASCWCHVPGACLSLE